MDLNLKSEKNSFLRPVYRDCVADEETTEVIVPDTLPDILRVVGADGTALLRGKNASNGKVVINGIVEGTVIYVPDNELIPEKLDVSFPFNISAEAQDIDDDCFLTAGVTLLTMEVKLLNPRKVYIKAALSADIGCYLRQEINVCSCDTQNGSTEILEDAASVTVPVNVSEKTFIITDDLKIPSAKRSFGEMMRTYVRMSADETKSIGNKAVVRGNIFTDILYKSAENTMFDSVSFVMPFSEIIEAVADDGGTDNEVIIMPTGIYLSRGLPGEIGEETLSLEIHGVIQCITYAQMDITYIRDVYDTKYPLENSSERISVPDLPRRAAVPVTIVGAAKTATQPTDVLMADVKIGEVSYIDEGNGKKLAAEIYVCAIYLGEDGNIAMINKRFIADGGPAEKSMQSMAVWNGEMFTNISGSGIEVRFPVTFDLRSRETFEFDAVNFINIDETHPIDMSGKPSLMIHRISEGDTLWLLAKRYCSTRQNILEANDINGNYPETGKILIIPKKR